VLPGTLRVQIDGFNSDRFFFIRLPSGTGYSEGLHLLTNSAGLAVPVRCRFCSITVTGGLCKQRLGCALKYVIMTDDNEQIQVEFHRKANAIFFDLLKNFELAVQGLDRQTEEYKFQQVKEAYNHSLKQQLENCATQLMQEHRQNRQGKDLSQNLQHHIMEYMHLFVQKTRTV
jgi:hypothetical protein